MTSINSDVAGMSVRQRHHLVEQVDIDPFDC
jgi:hypothetical protein